MGAIRTAKAAVIDQNSACVSATTVRLTSKTVKLPAKNDNTWPPANTASKTNSNTLRSVARVISISGSDIKATTHAYTVIITPASAGSMPKLRPISLNSAIGINSVVLKIKAAQASANTLSQREDSVAIDLPSVHKKAV